jgi:hypothetical protein
MPKGRRHTVQTARPWKGKPCKLEGCDRKNYGHGWCHPHYQQARRGFPPTLNTRTGKKHLDDVSYGGAHARVSAQWGKARLYDCVKCGGQAGEWAYDGTDPEQRLGLAWCGTEKIHYYSIHPEFYMPMCRPCHKGRDAALVAEELREYRRLKYKHGLTLSEIERLIIG